MAQDPPTPTDPRAAALEYERWNRIYRGEEYYYGSEPGPVARRAVRYHRPFSPRGGSALDAGCGEGQDLAFLAERGYTAVGVEFTPEGARKSRGLLQERGLRADVVQADLREFLSTDTTGAAGYDLVLAVNTLQFLGKDAPGCLARLMERVLPGGVFGLSMFARETGEAEVLGTVFFITWEELLERFRGWQMLEGAKLWQWNAATGEPQAFVTLVARKAPSAPRSLLKLG